MQNMRLLVIVTVFLLSMSLAFSPLTFSDSVNTTTSDLIKAVRAGTAVRPHIYVIYAGGTIGMVPTPDGYAPQPGYLTHLLDAELSFYFRSPDAPQYTVNEYTHLIDSSNATPADWKTIADDIYANYDAYDGFVVIHGTDTLAYTSSALSFLLGPELNKTVVVTGSQIPLSQTFNDGVFNLVGSFMTAAYSNVPEVGVFFNGRFIRGNRAQKMSAFDLDAFHSLSWPALAVMGTSMSVQRTNVRQPGSGHLTPPATPSTDVVHVTIYPGITGATVASQLAGARGAVLHCYGAGNAPDANEELISALDTAIRRGVVIVDISLTPKGLVMLGEYAVSSALARIGVLSGSDLTPEAAHTKLAWLIGRELPVKEVRELMVQDIVGELTPQGAVVDVVIEAPAHMVEGYSY